MNRIPGDRKSAGRENPRSAALRAFPEEAEGPKVRLRSESFADHYSQANLFYRSQSPIEQRHIADALVFELSKVETPAIRERVLAHLINIDKDLAANVAKGLGLKKLPKAATPAVTPRHDLPVSDALSILKNAPGTFKGRKLGVLVTDGADADILAALEDAVKGEEGTLELIAPTIGGVTLSDGNLVPAQHKVDGGPSVIFDAVAILASEDGVAALLKLPRRARLRRGCLCSLQVRGLHRARRRALRQGRSSRSILTMASCGLTAPMMPGNF